MVEPLELIVTNPARPGLGQQGTDLDKDLFGAVGSKISFTNQAVPRSHQQNGAVIT